MKTIIEQKLFEVVRAQFMRQRIGLALSGGVDSMLLAETLHRLKIFFVALHFNHRWRGKQSDADAQWVEKWCAKRKIPIEIGIAVHAGKTSENEARKARWNFLKNAATKHCLSEIWFAHHADDLVETFLLQLLRGAGPEGLASLKKTRKMRSLKIVRPLLQFFKEDIIRQAKAWKLKWREDASNRSDLHFRNRVRNRLLPILSKMAGRDVRKQIWRAVALLADENAFFESKLPKKWPQKASTKKLRKLPLPLQRRWLRGWLLFQNISDLSFDDIESVRLLLEKNKPSKINLSQKKFCRRKEGFIFIES